MNFIFVSTLTFENWDWTNPETRGIGGSETSHIEMARRLANRGHNVISYAPLPADKHDTIGPGGVRWRHSGSLFGGRVMIDEPAIWVVYRDPAFCSKSRPTSALSGTSPRTPNTWVGTGAGNGCHVTPHRASTGLLP